MTSQTRKQTITVHVSSNVSRNKGDQIMKLGQFIKYDVRNIFLKNHSENEEGRLFPDLCLLFKKVSYEIKGSGVHLISIYFNIHRLLYTININCIKL